MQEGYPVGVTSYQLGTCWVGEPRGCHFIPTRGVCLGVYTNQERAYGGAQGVSLNTNNWRAGKGGLKSVVTP